MSFLSNIASLPAVSKSALLSAADRNRRQVITAGIIAKREEGVISSAQKVSQKTDAYLQGFFSSSSVASSSEGSVSSVSSSKTGPYSRQRIDLSAVDPEHAKRLQKSRKYQETLRSRSTLSKEVTDEQLQQLLMSKQGQQRFPKTAAIFQQSKAQAAAATAAKAMVESMPKRAAHKQAIVGKLRGPMTAQDFHASFPSVSSRYARKAAAAVRAADEATAAGIQPKKKDIFTQPMMDGVEREKISPLERRTTASIVKENLGAKSGSNAAFWFGKLDSFHEWFRTTGHPLIFEQMVGDAGGIEQLGKQYKFGKWFQQNAEAYICQGACVEEGSGEVCHHNYAPRSRPTVANILKEEEVLFRCITKTVPCKWHDNYERWKAELTRLESSTGKRNHEKIHRLREKLKKCVKHEAQYNVQRRFSLYLLCLRHLCCAVALSK